MRSAYLHLFSNMFTSIAVLLGGLAMKYFQWYWADKIFSMGIAIYLLYLCCDIYKLTTRILMKHTPKSIDLKEIATEARTIKGVKSIYHIHAWQLDDHDIVFEAHVELEENIRINEFEIIAKEIHNILAKHHVFHATLQPEFEAEKTEILFNRTEVCKRPQIKIHHYRINVSQIWTPKVNKARKHQDKQLLNKHFIGLFHC